MNTNICLMQSKFANIAFVTCVYSNVSAVQWHTHLRFVYSVNGYWMSGRPCVARLSSARLIRPLNLLVVYTLRENCMTSLAMETERWRRVVAWDSFLFCFLLDMGKAMMRINELWWKGGWAANAPHCNSRSLQRTFHRLRHCLHGSHGPVVCELQH
jgi:hypothetical protein